MRVGLVVSSGLEPFDGLAPIPVETPWGAVTIHIGTWQGTDVAFLPRHGPSRRPPHRVDHRAHVEALARAGCARVLGVNSVGALRPDLPVPSLVVPHDLVDLVPREAHTFFDDHAVHVDFTAPYCPECRAALVAARPVGLPILPAGVYVTTRGPRLETPAEVRHLATMGDVVGMTGGPEATLARERGLCYASLCVVTNPGAGLSRAPLSAEAILAGVRRARGAVEDVLAQALRALPPARGCACAREGA